MLAAPRLQNTYNSNAGLALGAVRVCTLQGRLVRIGESSFGVFHLFSSFPCRCSFLTSLEAFVLRHSVRPLLQLMRVFYPTAGFGHRSSLFCRKAPDI